MAWYAIRTVPGAQVPQREYLVEPLLDTNGKPRGKKGYRIVPSLNPNFSAIEKALSERGFHYYMPAEKRLIRDRRKTHIFKTRRFALMVGYVFVCDPKDWLSLQETPGVAGIVSLRGKPMEIDFMDILIIRAMEAQAEVEFDRQSKNARQLIRKKAKTDERMKRIVQELDIAGLISVPLDAVDDAA